MPSVFDRILDAPRHVRRNRWTALVVAWLICLVGWSAVLLLPPTGAATTPVLVVEGDASPLVRALADLARLRADIEATEGRISGYDQRLAGYLRGESGATAKASVRETLQANLVQERAALAGLHVRLKEIAAVVRDTAKAAATDGPPSRDVPATLNRSGPAGRGHTSSLLLPLDSGFPDRLSLLAAVAAAGLVAGLVAATAVGCVNPSYDDPDDLQTDLGLPVLGSIGTVRTGRASRSKRRETVAFGLGCLMLLSVFGGIAAAERQRWLDPLPDVLPLPLAWLQSA